MRGFSLVELMIAIAIVAMLVGVSVPVMDNVTRADLRAAASKTSGMVKATYDMAVLSGKPSRLMFDFAANTITAEVASERVTLGEEEMKPEDDDDKPLDRKDKLAAMAKKGAAMKTRKTASFTRAPGTVVYELPHGIRIADISAEHLKGQEHEGKVGIFFFPMGYCEHAVIHYQDTSDRVYAVEVEPLTGRTRIADKRIDFKDEK